MTVRYTIKDYVVISTKKHVRELYNNFLHGGPKLQDGLSEWDIYIFNHFVYRCYNINSK